MNATLDDRSATLSQLNINQLEIVMVLDLFLTGNSCYLAFCFMLYKASLVSKSDNNLHSVIGLTL